MGVTGNLAALRQGVRPLEGEVMIEGWAAERVRGEECVCGLVLVTNWRIMFIDAQGGLSALPIFKIDYAEHRSPTCVVLSTWYDRMHLSFDSPAALGAVANLLRQDPCWGAAEFDLARDPAGDALKARNLLPAIAS
ncbi:hypothetical protein [Phenylobacterium sp.]|uniref:hypothetical protein n=1 Tax=Phenylobacterium sp. TaxID=1871053 RepID=UPI00289C613B|nr:hypothetical protein [Phenylobacterium sp.]